MQVNVETPKDGNPAQKGSENVSKSKNKFPIIGDDSVFSFRLITFIAFAGALVTGTIYITNLNNKVDQLTGTCNRIENNFDDLIKALGLQKFGRPGNARGD